MRKIRKILSALAFAGVVLPVTLLATPTQAGPQTATHTALAQIGDPYILGAEGPKAFDCSGLVQYSFSRAGYGHVPRTAQAQSQRAHRISRSSTRRGDLLFYYNTSGHVFHVAIYLGHGRVVEAARPGTDVRTAPVWNAPHFSGSLN